jgi:phosphohistidine phosphatase
MNLFFLRHAKAEPRGPQYRPDRKRPLTPEGEKTMNKAAEGMVAMGLSFDLILTSPYIRAHRTAQIAAAAFKTDKIWISQNLVSEGSNKKLIDEINENYSLLKDILIVGHNPNLPELISVLLTGGTDLKIDLKKSGLCKLAVEDLRHDQCATMEWLLTPRQLQRMS